MTTPTPPPYDLELEAFLSAFPAPPPEVLEAALDIGGLRALMGEPDPAAVLSGRPLEHREYAVPGPPGDPDIVVSVIRRADHTAAGGAIYYTHGGGMVAGHRFSDSDMIIDWVERFDLVLVTVEYRLAPEHRHPAPVEDCYAGLIWTAEHAGDLGFDPARLIILGVSAGGALAAGVTLLARDRSGPRLAGQMLWYPMLDDRDATVSTHQYPETGMWDRRQNAMGWSALLGERYGGPDVPFAAAPGRATDLSDLPPASIDVGSADIFRDEDVAYASAIWAAGGDAELHVWPGGFHGFDGAVPHAAISVACREARERWLRRILGI